MRLLRTALALAACASMTQSISPTLADATTASATSSTVATTDQAEQSKTAAFAALMRMSTIKSFSDMDLCVTKSSAAYAAEQIASGIETSLILKSMTDPQAAKLSHDLTLYDASFGINDTAPDPTSSTPLPPKAVSRGHEYLSGLSSFLDRCAHLDGSHADVKQEMVSAFPSENLPTDRSEYNFDLVDQQTIIITTTTRIQGARNRWICRLEDGQWRLDVAPQLVGATKDLFESIDSDYPAALIDLLSRHPEVIQSHNDNGDAPLIDVSLTNNADLALILAAHHENVNEIDRYGFTPLMNASEGGNFDVVSVLLKRGANSALKNPAGKTAADLADVSNHPDIAALLRGEPLAAVPNNTATAAPALTADQEEAAAFQPIATIHTTLSQTAKIDCLTNATAGWLGLIEGGMIEMSAQFQTDPKSKVTPKFVADVAAYMNTYGINPQSMLQLGDNGPPPLVLTKGREFLTGLEPFVDTATAPSSSGQQNAPGSSLTDSVDPSSTTYPTRASYDLTVIDPSTVRLVTLNRDAKMTNLFYSKFEDGAWRLDMNVNPKSSPLSDQVFMGVSKIGGQPLLTELLTDEPDLIECKNELGDTPIIVDSLSSDTEVAKILVAHHTNVNEKDIFGCTPLINAVENNSGIMVQFLLNNGADVTLTNAAGKTPLAIAKEKGFTDIEATLSQCGAK